MLASALEGRTLGWGPCGAEGPVGARAAVARAPINTRLSGGAAGRAHPLGMPSPRRDSLPFLLLALSLTACGASAPADVPCDAACQTLWSKSLGAAGWSQDQHLAVDGQGGVLVTGTVSGVAPQLGVGDADLGRMFVSRFDSAGQLAWGRAIAGSDGARVSSVAVDAAGGVALGGTFVGADLDFGAGAVASAEPGAGAMFVARLDPRGKAVWSRAFGANQPDGTRDAEATAVAVDATGALVVAGYFIGPLDLGGGDLGFAPPPPDQPAEGDAFLAKFDAAGHHLWSRRLADRLATSALFIDGLAVDGDGSIAVAGTLYGAALFGAEVLMSAGAGDLFVARLGADGTLTGSRTYGGVDSDSVSGIALGLDGSMVLAASVSPAPSLGIGAPSSPTIPHALVLALDADGEVAWQTPVGPISADGGYGVDVGVDARGDVIALARAGATPDVTIVKLDGAGGGVLRSLAFTPVASPPNEALFSNLRLAVDPAGHALVAGSLMGTVDFGTGVVNAGGDPWTPQLIAAKLAP